MSIRFAGGSISTESGSIPSLEHPTRARIYDHLLVLPGDHFRSIVRHLGLSHGTATHHLGVLVKSGVVGIDRADGRARYYPKSAGSEADRNALYAKHWNYRGVQRRVLLVIRTMSAATAAAVAKSLGISRQLASYHLQQLADRGIVQRENGHFRI